MEITLAQLIRKSRLIEEMTLLELANASGVSKSYISEIENGVSWKISIQFAYRLADALCIPLERVGRAAIESEKEAQ